MSVQSAKDFIEQLETDESLKKRLEAAVDDEARRSIIQAAGFDFTREEFHQAVGDLAAAAHRELTPEELQNIAGGGRPGPLVLDPQLQQSNSTFIIPSLWINPK